MNESPAALRFEGLRKRFGARVVLEDLTLSVGRGEFFGLVGVNGAGKTTCIKSLLDFAGFDAGSIEIFGVAHTETEARGPLAFLPERFLPPYYLGGRGFLRYMARLHGGSRYAEDAARAMCERLDLDPEALSRPVREYSKGMAQKLGLVACFLGDKPLYVLDEPMSGLDPKARLLVKRELQRLHGEGRTVFFSTHMLADVEELCDRMGVLHAGRIRFAGSPGECRERFGAATLEQAYLDCIAETDAARAAAT